MASAAVAAAPQKNALPVPAASVQTFGRKVRFSISIL